MSTAHDHSALDLVPEAVVIVDDAGRVTYRNARAATLLGFDCSCTGKPLGEVLDLRDDSGERVSDPPTAPPAIGDRLPERVLRVRLPDGRLRPVSVAGRYLPGGGSVLTFRHAGRRERVDAARSDLVATVSHEIRSPLTSVKGFTRTMLAKWDRFSDEQKRQMLATINEDADRVTRLLTELLDVSRIDAGRLQLHRRMVDVPAVLAAAAERARHRSDGRKIDVDTAPDVPALYLDPDKFEQVVTNLLDNALDHAPASPVSVRAVDHHDSVEIVVSDEGPGIPPDQLRHIFGKFSRGRGTRRAGTGLGLFITKGIVEAHGGRVWAESEEGVGSAFHVILPKGGPERLAARRAGA